MPVQPLRRTLLVAQNALVPKLWLFAHAFEADHAAVFAQAALAGRVVAVRLVVPAFVLAAAHLDQVGATLHTVANTRIFAFAGFAVRKAKVLLAAATAVPFGARAPSTLFFAPMLTRILSLAALCFYAFQRMNGRLPQTEQRLRRINLGFRHACRVSCPVCVCLRSSLSSLFINVDSRTEVYNFCFSFFVKNLCPKILVPKRQVRVNTGSNNAKRCVFNFPKKTQLATFRA